MTIHENWKSDLANLIDAEVHDCAAIGSHQKEKQTCHVNEIIALFEAAIESYREKVKYEIKIAISDHAPTDRIIGRDMMLEILDKTNPITKEQ